MLLLYVLLLCLRLEQDSENQVNGVAAGRSDSAPGADEWGEAGRRAEEESRENRLRERRSPPNRYDRAVTELEIGCEIALMPIE